MLELKWKIFLSPIKIVLQNEATLRTSSFLTDGSGLAKCVQLTVIATKNTRIVIKNILKVNLTLDRKVIEE